MNLICINCPRGCHLIVEKVKEEIQVEGNACPRGYTYAVNELTNPLRTLTTTVGIESETQKRLPVISSAPLPKGRIMEAMKALKDVEVQAPVHMGDPVYKNVLNLGIDIIASRSIEK
ncbi:MAG: DUF1667 domain-containing protein [Erysipelotrichaceae bacterium]|nr:DUF1667 domain-containing protein [Erysipelotrichaceae bacterium]